MNDYVLDEAGTLANKAAKLGFLINILLPAVIALAGLGLREMGMVADGTMDYETITLLVYVLGAAAIGELVVAFFLRKQFLAPQRLKAVRGDSAKTEQHVTRSCTIVFALGASPMIYGVVLYLLGGNPKHLAFFGLITLLTYRLLRPTRDFLEDALDKADSA